MERLNQKARWLSLMLNIYASACGIEEDRHPDNHFSSEGNIPFEAIYEEELLELLKRRD